MTNGRTIAILAFGLTVSGCTGDKAPPVAAAGQSLSTENALSYNRLSMNRLSMNRLSMNSLSSDELETTQEGRGLLRYIARCALNPADTLVVTTGGIEYEFPGLLNLAPEWEDDALTASQERMLSACLVAHVNAYGVSVGVSMRAPGDPRQLFLPVVLPHGKMLLSSNCRAGHASQAFATGRRSEFVCSNVRVEPAQLANMSARAFLCLQLLTRRWSVRS